MWVFVILISLFVGIMPDEEPDFKRAHLEHKRVQMAVAEKTPWIAHMLQLEGISIDSFDMYIRAFKFEEDLEIWAKNRDSSEYKLIQTYKFCSNVGSLGPKRRQGDLQIPEGFYSMSKFNPNSNYHLSLKVNYPNKADSIKGFSSDLGGMIFIHGGCNTIGCIPITNDKIKEVYVMAYLARSSGQKEIPIHIYPLRLSFENIALLQAANPSTELMHFWKALGQGYHYFESRRQIPPIRISERGDYLLDPT